MILGLLVVFAAGPAAFAQTAAKDLPDIMPGPDMPPAVVLTRDSLENSATGESGEVVLPGGAMPANTQLSGFAWSAQQRGEMLVRMAETYLGLPYRYGGSQPQTGFDCSGYTGYLYNKFGIQLPRSAYAQSVSDRLIPATKPAPGDLVFFKIDHKRVSHVGMYVGGDIFIHSPRTGKNIEFGDLTLPYWKTRFAGARGPRDS